MIAPSGFPRILLLSPPEFPFATLLAVLRPPGCVAPPWLCCAPLSVLYPAWLCYTPPARLKQTLLWIRSIAPVQHSTCPVFAAWHLSSVRCSGSDAVRCMLCTTPSLPAPHANHACTTRASPIMPAHARDSPIIPDNLACIIFDVIMHRTHRCCFELAR